MKSTLRLEGAIKEIGSFPSNFLLWQMYKQKYLSRWNWYDNTLTKGSFFNYLHMLVDAMDMVVSPRHEKHVKVRGGN